ncbi:hypothetical protein POTOM_043014 [Populus tomentosa]|uniref:Uncharacterized protein n=1 Tax=Populus tomentosa TaxID=118781 RepID=A0A8X7YPU9_POPTO|nr:hypothetical protein POTOM_043014 [Populus tomentosa]
MLCAQKLRLHLIGNPRIPSENYTFISIKGGIPDRLKLLIRLSGGPPLIDRGNLKSPLCGFTSKYLKKHEMRAQEKAKRKLGDIGEPWVEDKGHDQTVFSDEYFASVPGV